MSNNLPPIYKFDFGDYQPLGSTFQKFLANLNLFTQAIYNLVNGGIGFQNMQRTIYSVTVTAGTLTTIAFVNPLPVAPSGVSVVKALLPGKVNTPLTTAVSAANWVYDGTTITVLNVTGLTSGSTYQISLEVC